jgi:hypothetical protein
MVCDLTGHVAHPIANIACKLQLIWFMMKSSPISAIPNAMKLASSEQAVAFLLAFAFLVLQPTAKAALPKYAFSVPAGLNAAEGIRTAEPCGTKGKVLVMPALSFQLAGETGATSAYEEQTRALMGISEDAEVFLNATVAAGSLTGADTEQQIAERVAAFLKRLPLSSPPVRALLVEVQEPLTNPNLFAYSLVNLAVTAKAAKTGLSVSFVFPTGFIGRYGDIVKRLATYSDFIGIRYTAGWENEAKWIAEQAMNKPVILKLSAAQPPSYLAAVLAGSDTGVQVIWAEPADSAALTGLCRVNDFATQFITSEMVSVGIGATPFTIAADGVGPSDQKWFTSGPSGDVSVVVRVNASAGRPKTLKLHGASTVQFETQWYDPLTGSKLAAGESTKTQQGVDQSSTSESEYALVVAHRTGSADERLFTAVEVKGKADLTVEEIIARWQEYRAVQRQRLENYLASCLMNLHFEGTNIGSGFDISMRFKQFANKAGLVEWAQTEFYVNGVKFSNKREFPLPQLEPEKVMTQPLELRLNEKYEYKLLGTEKVNGVYCYVVGVEPKVQGETLYSGKIWIDGSTFRQVKQYLRQRGEKSNVVSNVETQNFELVADGKGNQFNLVKSISAQQLLNAAGRDFVLQKTYDFSGYVINNQGFESQLAAAHDSADPMFKETEEGLRSLRKRGGERILEPKAGKVVRSVVVGTMYEGTFDFPIPIAGFSVADFNFRNSGAQLSLFFAGPILVGDLSKQYGTRFRLALDLALSGLPGNNRIYSGNTELKDQTLWAWNEDTGVRATWQATTSLSLTASSYLSYEFFRGTSDLDKQFTLPRNGVTLLPGAEMKYARKGYVFSAQGTRGERLGWTQFGFTAQPSPLYSGFTRYNADFNKTFYMRKFTRAGWDFAYFGGNQLDRFSRYRPSFFSRPRIHGIPGGTDSFDAIAVGSVNYGFNVMDLFKFEGTYSYARARNLEESRRFKKFDGVETNFGTAGPFGTYFQGTISYALHANTPRYNSRWGVYVLIFKPLR